MSDHGDRRLIAARPYSTYVGDYAEFNLTEHKARPKSMSLLTSRGLRRSRCARSLGFDQLSQCYDRSIVVQCNGATYTLDEEEEQCEENMFPEFYDDPLTGCATTTSRWVLEYQG